MHVDWSVTFGEALTVVSIIVGALTVVFGMRGDIRILKLDIHGINEKISILNTSFERLGDILTKVAVQDVRINRIEDDVRELRHGEGMVLPFKSKYEVP